MPRGRVLQLRWRLSRPPEARCRTPRAEGGLSMPMDHPPQTQEEGRRAARRRTCRIELVGQDLLQGTRWCSRRICSYTLSLSGIVHMHRNVLRQDVERKIKHRGATPTIISLYHTHREALLLQPRRKAVGACSVRSADRRSRYTATRFEN